MTREELHEAVADMIEDCGVGRYNQSQAWRLSAFLMCLARAAEIRANATSHRLAGNIERAEMQEAHSLEWLEDAKQFFGPGEDEELSDEEAAQVTRDKAELDYPFQQEKEEPDDDVV